MKTCLEETLWCDSITGARPAFSANSAKERRELEGFGRRAHVPPVARMARSTTSLMCVLALAGCTAPDLTPFANASRALSTSVNTGGELTITPLARIPLWDGKRFVPPSDPNHPYRVIEKSWKIRRKTMDAVLVYSASLAAINGASARHKENVADLVGSVKQLASAVPGVNVSTNAAGDLVVAALGNVVEVKAWHDMAKAVRAADPAIQLVATKLKDDFTQLSNLFESPLLDESIQVGRELRPVTAVYDKLQEQRQAQRDRVVKAPGDVGAGDELARLDTLTASIEQDLSRLQSERARIDRSLTEGKAVFAATITTIDAWASAHADLVKSLEQNRAPNLALLVARAEELKEIIDRIGR